MSVDAEDQWSGLPSGVLTFLFTDIEGSTRLAHELGDAWLGVLDAHHQVLREAFTAHGGREVSTAGDSFFVVFVDANDAVAATITMQRAIAAHDWSPHKPIRVRMGVHTGEGTLHDDTYAGLNVHAASRVESAAAGGQVLISAATLAAASPLPRGVDVLDLGPHRLKDLPAEVQLYQLVADGLMRDFPPVRGIDIAKNNVPVPPSSFVGRAEALTKLHGVMDDARIVTLVGTGGTGKTRLAIKLAGERLYRHKDGVWFVELESATDRASVASAIAHAMGIAEDPTRPIIDVVVEHVADLDTLLVIDNCEHVIDDAAALVETIARTGHGVRVIATSREPLQIAGERLWPVSPLAIEGDDPNNVEAVQLLADRIELVRPEFVLDEATGAQLFTIARQLDGLPLALELAAASAALLELDEIAEQLEDRFGLLTHGTRTASDRQKTLRGAIEWSYGLLGDEERTLFRRLGVFPGEFDDPSVAGVFETDLMVVAAGTRRLAAKSLVSVTSAQRFRMLESIRAFARTTAAEAGEIDGLLEQHARWFTAGAVDPTDAHGWAREPDGFENVHDDLVAALRWTKTYEPASSLRLLQPLQVRWMRKGRWAEARALSTETLDATQELVSEDRLRAVSRTAELALRQADFDTARSLFEDAVEIGRTIYGDDRTEMLLADLGLVAQRRGQLDEATELLSRALASARGAGSLPQAAGILIHLAETARMRGDSEEAWRVGYEALSTAIDLGAKGLILPARILVGSVAHERGDLAGARDLYRSALDDAIAAGDDSVLYLTYRLGLLEFETGDRPAAAMLLTDAITQGRDLDARADLAESLEAAARLVADDQPDHSARLLAAVDRIRADIGFPRAPAEVATYDDLRNALRERCGGSFDAEETLGATWSLEIAVNAALDGLAQVSAHHDARPS